MTGSLRAYAKHRREAGLSGGSLSAVQKAIASSRITKGSDGKIDFDRADREWEENLNRHKLTSHDKQPGEAVVATSQLLGVPSGNFLEAQRQHEWLKAQKVDLELKVRRGEVLEKEELQETLGEILIGMRNKALAMPANLAQKLAIETDPITIEQILTTQMEDLLRELSEWKPNVAAA